MKSIAGLLAFDRPISALELGRIGAALAGPGHHGVAQVHGSLALIGSDPVDHAAGHMPRASDAESSPCVADARIDNPDAIIVAGEQARRSDSDVIRVAYQRWGQDCPQQLIGDFAFALWDNDKSRLFCARDPSGVRPFFYSLTPGRSFVFASELRCLVSLLETLELDEEAVADYLCQVSPNPTHTMLARVRRLPAGHAAMLDRGILRVWRYWDPAGTAIESDHGSEPPESAIGRFRSQFFRAVAVRLRDAAPVSVALSGGLDSASVACVAARVAREGYASFPINAISAVFDDCRSCDERAYSSQLEDDFLRSHWVFPERANHAEVLETVLPRADDPSDLLWYHVTWSVYRRARELGSNVALVGTLGDAVGGYGGPIAGLELLAALHWSAFSRHQMARARAIGRSPVGLLAAEVRALAGLSYRSVCPWALPRPRSWILNVVDKGFASRVAFADRLGVSASWQTALTSRKRALGAMRSGALTPEAERSGRFGRWHGIEVRQPFLDRMVMETGLAVPIALRTRGGRSRYLLREAMRGVLPETVRLRPDKCNFDPFLGRTELELVRAMSGGARRIAASVDGIIDSKGLALAISEASETTHRDMRHLWSCIALALWLDNIRATQRNL